MSLQQDVLRVARSWLGVPFAHQGRSRAGVDCLGLLVMVAKDLNLSFHGENATQVDELHYSHRPDVMRLEAGLRRYLLPVKCEDMALADILLMRIDGAPQHLGIISDYADGTCFGLIHAYAPARKVVEHHLAEYWQAEIAQVFRLPLWMKS